MQTARLIHPLIIRYAIRHKVIVVLNILSIALGVAVYLAIQTANYSANRAFEAGVDLVAGKSQLEIRPTIESEGIDDSLLPEISKFPGIKATTPVVQGYVSLVGSEGEYLRILGIDPFTNNEFRTDEVSITSGGYQDSFTDWLAQPNTLALSAEFCRRNELRRGDVFDVTVNGQIIPVAVGFITERDPSRDGQISSRVAAMDIGWAQELLGKAGRLTSIQLVLDDPSSLRETIQRLNKVLPTDAKVATPEQRSLQVQLMLEGFQLNLRALAMISLLVGVFLIYNTVSASVVRRRKEIGALRSIGASAQQIQGIFLLEAFVLGLMGIAIGILGGIALAHSLIDSMSKVVSAHYVLVSIEQPFFSLGRILEASLAGFATVIVGAWFPAREAAHLQPIDALRNTNLFDQCSIRPRILLFAGIASIVLAGTFSWLALTTAPPWLSFAACFFLLLGFSMIMPQLSLVVSKTLKAASSSSILPLLCADDFARSLNRTSVTAAALMAAIAMMIGVSVMIASFRSTLDSWIHRTVIADIYVAPAANETTGIESFMPNDFVNKLRKHPSVESVDRFRYTEVLLNNVPVHLSVVDGIDRENFSFTGGKDAEKSGRFFREQSVIASEILAAKHELKSGDSLRLQTPLGLRTFTVAGVYYDYADSQGRLMMTRSVFDRYWKDERFHSAAIYVRENTSENAIQHLCELIRTENKDNALAVYSNRALRSRALDIFDQTFAITGVLRIIAVLVAVLGIILSLTTLVMERSREIALYRSLGASQLQSTLLIVGQGALLGASSSIGGIACGTLLSMVLTWVVNKAFFGWTIHFQLPISDLLLTPFWVIPISILVALIPARKARRLPLSQALRTE